MNTNLTLFAQIIQSLCRNSFKTLVKTYGTDKHNKGIDSWTHLITMLFCQLSKLDSLRDVTNGLRSASGNLNHLGLQKAPSKSSLAYQNQNREWPFFRIKSKIFLLDSTTISLCLSLFDWAKFRKRKGAIKLHTLLDYDGCLPVYVNLTDGKVNDANAIKEIVLSPDTVVVADRAYVDFENLYRWHTSKSFFVVRLKKSVKFNRLNEKELPDDRHQHILVDKYIELSEEKTKAKYPKNISAHSD